MKARAVAVICPHCGEDMPVSRWFTEGDFWLGYIKYGYHGCEGRSCPVVAYLILYDEQKRFVAIIPGTDRFLNSAGNRIHIHDSEEMPF